MNKLKKLSTLILVLILITSFTLPTSAAPLTFRIGGGEYDRIQEIESILDTIEYYYLDEVDRDVLIDGALKGIFETLDKYSTYYTPQEFNDLNSSISGDFSGVGMYIEKKGDYITVLSPIEGSPAHKAGLQPGDKIAEVDGVNVKGQDLSKVQAMILGEPGTKVQLGILRGSSTKIIYFDITRARISISPIKYEILEGNIGYLKISEFNSHLTTSLDNALNHFNKSKVKKVILDLRDNPGGLLNQAISVSRKLVPAGPILHIYNRDGLKETHRSFLTKAPYELSVLVNGSTASASEIVAAAIQDSGAGKIVGTTTFGKGVIQYVLPSDNGAGYKMTVEEYRSPKGNKIHGVGITPDIMVENTLPDHINIEELVELVPIRDITRGTMGYDVYAVQQRLHYMNYFNNQVTGMYSTSTLISLRNFCKDNNLDFEGTITKDIQSELNRAFAKFLRDQTIDTQLQKAIEALR